MPIPMLPKPCERCKWRDTTFCKSCVKWDMFEDYFANVSDRTTEKEENTTNAP